MKTFILITFLILILITPPLYAASSIIQAKGMMCESCVQTVTDGFMKIEGVKNVTINLENQTVTVESDMPIEPDSARTILTDRGYEFIEIQTENPISSINE